MTRPSAATAIKIAERNEKRRKKGPAGLIGSGLACLQCAWSGTFPTSIPPGSYYVGCIIDTAGQVTEGDETNNTGYAGSMLTVLAAVPNVVGMPQSKAESVITGAGLVVGTKTFQCSSTVVAGNVISQSPTGGTSLPPGSAVNLTLSTGPCEVIVPNVVGTTESSAQSAILKYGLVVGTKTWQCSATVAAGRVISQSPSAGTSVASGSPVNMTISSGPCQATVPNVVGMTESAAGSSITSAGLVVGTKTSQCSATVAVGKVISQSPSAGTSVASGSAVNLTISSGPCQATIPNVAGMTESAAGSAITSAGLIVGTKTSQCSATVAVGKVISQSPAAGTSVSSGSAVNLTISSGPCQGNHPPTAKDDSASVAPGGSIAIDVLSNDSDPDPDTLTITGVTQPQHGTVTYTGQAATYTGDRAWKGTDTFTYTISDGHGGTATATVTVTTQSNRPPVANDDSAATTRDEPATIPVLANDSDPDNNPLTVTKTTAPAHGEVTQDGQTVTYMPSEGWAGTDTFTYTISDNKGGTATSTVTVSVVDFVQQRPQVVTDAQFRQEKVAGVLVPVCMYYVERYFGGIRQTEVDQRVAAILDNSPAGREAFQTALVNYHNMSADERSQEYDGEVLQALSNIEKTLDVSFIKGKLKDVDPEMVVDLDAPPDAPSELMATNASPYLGTEIFQPAENKIQLTWRDNSFDEAGFRIYRSHATSTGTVAWVGLNPQLVATIGANVTTYVDKMGYPETPCTGGDVYSYNVTAYKNPFIALPGSVPPIIESKYSNLAYASCVCRPRPPCRDDDHDGVCDDGDVDTDLCPHYPGTYACRGCPDSDGDGAPDFVEDVDTENYTDMCPGIRGQAPGPFVPPANRGVPRYTR
jgi:beta-lactam-binding protein with PASTA domain